MPVIAVTVPPDGHPEDWSMAQRELYLYVVDGCETCQRARARLESCKTIAARGTLVVRSLSEPSTKRPAALVGVPSVMLEGEIIAMGTPDCCAVGALLAAMDRE